MSNTYLGIDIGGTKILSGLVDSKGRVREIMYSQTETQKGKKDLLVRLKEIIRNYLKKCSQIKGIGISTGGRVDFDKGKVIYATSLLPDWEGLNLKRLVEKEFSIPCLVENDANCALIAEKIFGVGKGHSDIVMFTLGTGLGSAIILKESLIRGKSGLGGELGHSIIKDGGRVCNCGKKGCLEAYASGWAVERKAKRFIRLHKNSNIFKSACFKNEKLTMRMIIEMAKKGDEFASELTDEFCHYLAVGIDTVINGMGVDFFIIGGGIAEGGGNFLLKRIKNALYEISSFTPYVSPCITLAKLKNKAGMIGAAMLFCFDKNL